MSASEGQHEAALHPLGVSRLIEVRLGEDGFPTAVRRTRGARRGPATSVTSVEDVWRVAEEWWREEPQNRTYMRVLLESGGELTLYLDGRSGVWFEQPYGEVAP